MIEVALLSFDRSLGITVKGLALKLLRSKITNAGRSPSGTGRRDGHRACRVSAVYRQSFGFQRRAGPV